MRGDGIHIVMSNCSLEIADKPIVMKGVIDGIIRFAELKRLGRGNAQRGTNSMEGWSVVQIIETSHIAIHGFKTNNVYMIDVVSCKPFDYQKLVQNMKYSHTLKGRVSYEEN
jgi:S-adenosylmethionine/arginine decarboxylase-like enzyme